MDPTYRPSYDVWLNSCMHFIGAVKMHGRTSNTGIDLASVRLANGLEEIAGSMIEARFAEQTHHKRAPAAANVEVDIQRIKDYLQPQRETLQRLANADFLQSGSATGLLEYLDCEISSAGYQRLPNILSFKDSKEHMNSLLERTLTRLKSQNIPG